VAGLERELLMKDTKFEPELEEEDGRESGFSSPEPTEILADTGVDLTPERNPEALPELGLEASQFIEEEMDEVKVLEPELMPEFEGNHETGFSEPESEESETEMEDDPDMLSDEELEVEEEPEVLAKREAEKSSLRLSISNSLILAAFQLAAMEEEAKALKLKNSKESESRLAKLEKQAETLEVEVARMEKELERLDYI